MKNRLKLHIMKIVALFIVLVFYALTLPEKISTTEKDALLKEYAFDVVSLFTPQKSQKKIRDVHPQYENIVSWISAVGAAVAIDDIDEDGKLNDIIHVDPRFDDVIISAAPNTGNRYAPFVLAPTTLPYDKSTTAPMGVLTNDFNLDGKNDILVYYWGRSPIIFLKDGAGYTEFELVTAKERWFSNAATLADFDGDGNVDILVTNYFPDASRVLDKNASDKNQTMQHSMSRAFNGGKDHFLLFNGIDENNNPIYLENNSWKNGIENPEDWTLAVGAVDLTGDLLPEIYFANDFGPDKFLLNESTPGNLKFKPLYGERDFTTIASSVLGKDSFKGMGVGIGDMNNDGLFDLYISNIADEYALEESHFAFINQGDILKYKQGIAPFINESESMGLSRSSWGWDSKLGDFNNDGILEAVQATGFLKGHTDRWAELQELALGNDELLAYPNSWPKFKEGDDLSGFEHNPFFVKTKDGKYFDLAKELGIGTEQVTRGIAIGDTDYDGDLDFAYANQWETSYFHVNNYKGVNSFLGLQILLPIETDKVNQLLFSNEENIKTRPAIGAIVKLYKGEKVWQVNYVDGGNGHSGANTKDVFFGLNKDTNEKLRIEILYLDGKGNKQQKEVFLNKGWHTIILPN